MSFQSGAQVHCSSIHNRMVLSSDEETETPPSTRMDFSSPETAQSAPSTSSGSIEMAKDNDTTSFDFDSKPSKIRLPRKMLMKDLLGELAKQKKSKQDDASSIPSKKMPWAVSEVTASCRFVRVGTMPLTIQKPVTFTTENIRIDDQVCVQASTVVSCEMCFSKRLPSLLLKATPAECLRLCYLLKMSRSHGGTWVDSNSPNLGENYIILVFKGSLPEQDEVLLKDILTEIGRAEGVDDFISEITFEEANKILMHGKKDSPKDQSCTSQSLLPDCHVSLPKISATARFPPQFHPKTFQQMFLDTFSTQTQPVSVAQQKDSKGVSHLLKKKAPERCLRSNTRASYPTCLSDGNDENNDVVEVLPVFSDPVQRLVLYPPPPARGGISVTNEDLHCLNQGEFLNDVIIDFYLKYLMLKEENAMRSHVFSSFFYKRLTQTEQGQAQAPENLLERKLRHSRVRTWTRNVDLFQKDFIFVPINESAHWFLAVICFPDLAGAQSDPGPPSPSPLSSASPQWPSPGPLSTFQQEDDEEEPSCLDQGFLSSFTPPGPNPMSLFFRPMNSIATSYPDPGSSPGSFPEGDLTIGFSLRVCSDLQEKEMGTGVRELGVNSYTLTTGQKARQTDRNHDFFDVTPKAATHRRPCILIMDSLSGNGRLDVVKILQEYLEVEWELRKGTKRRFCRDTMRGSNPRVPQQDNYSDCGVYLLQYVESFFQNPPQSFEQPMDLSKWFPLKRVKRKRAEIKELIVKIHQQQESGVTANHHRRDTFPYLK
ncbi:sentrin-specific protease 6 isoform X2 [Osmerus eperlanus]|uniref:sentrin-specific protease 6 isoform X2 n=1 Tax=Osmerus eperlanus TaxID=29151 RepID=UPI002E155746